MANSGIQEGSRCNTGLCTHSEAEGCGTCTNDFSFQCGFRWWVERSARSRTGIIRYALAIRGNSSYMTTYTLHCYDTVLNGANFGKINSPQQWRSSNQWYDLAGVTGSQSFTYNSDGSAPDIRLNSGGSQFNCKPYCKNKTCYTTLGGFTVRPDTITPDWNERPSNLSGSASNATCDGITLKFNVGNSGYPSNTTTSIQYGLTTSYGQETSSSTAKSGSFILTGLNGGTTYHYRVKTTNSTGTSYSSDYTFKTKGSLPTAGTPSATNPNAFQIVFTLDNISWLGGDGCDVTSKKVKLTWSYSMDGKDYSFSQNWSGDSIGNTIVYDTGQDLDRIPDDETLDYTWTLSTNIGNTILTGKIYCQPSYEAWLIGPSTEDQWVECELYASEKPGINSYKKVRRVTSITN